MTTQNNISNQQNHDPIEIIYERLEQLHALLIMNVGNEKLDEWTYKTADGYFGACAELVKQAENALVEYRRSVTGNYIP